MKTLLLKNQERIEKDLKQGKKRIFFSPSAYWDKKVYHCSCEAKRGSSKY